VHHPTAQRALFEETFAKPVVVQFDGEQSSSDGGALLLGAVDRRIGLTETLSRTLVDRRDGRRVEHGVDELFRQRVFSIALGYCDQNDAARVGSDPVLKMLCGRSPNDPSSLGSQPTLSRFETSRSGRELVLLGRRLERFVIERLKKSHRKARRITIDLDSTEDPTHGQQPFAFFNGYYDSWCYLPMLGFLSVDDEPVQHLFHARLRPGTARDARGTLALLLRTVKMLRKAFKKAQILLRCDAGFAHPELFALLDRLRVDYVVAMAGNPVLQEVACEPMRVVRELAERFDGSLATWGETSYRAQSWRRARRVIFKAEALVYPERELKDNLRFVVTSLALAPKKAWELYCQRGDVENRIKELHDGLELDRTSCTSFLANHFRVLQTATAYVLYQELRVRLSKTDLARAQVTTLREKLIRIGAVVKESVRRIVLSLPASYPWKKLWHEAAHSLGALVT
jgi:hypothetical protein